mgnify:FL=1
MLLRHRASGQYVPATLIDGVSKAEVEGAEKVWRPFIQEAVTLMEAENRPRELRPQHAHWDWRKKHQLTEGLLAYQTLGVECEGEMQGLILLKTAGKMSRIANQKSNGLVYVSFIETAPWNSPIIVPEPRYSQVGTVLLAAVIDISVDLGFKGRVGLHALPQAESWYATHCEMTNFGPDAAYQNLTYFEMTSEQAANFRA